MILEVQLKVAISFGKQAELPLHKASAFRGGLGEMLLMEHCISDKNCKECVFGEECVVPRIYYHKLKIVPPFVTEGESLGYMFSCEDERTHVREGDQLEFQLTLFGDVIVHFSTILQALYRLGMAGLGKDHAQFTLEKITTRTGDVVFDNGNVYLANLTSENLLEVALEKAGDTTASSFVVRFKSPWTQKFRGEFLTEFNKDAFVESVFRRVYLLNCLEGNETEMRPEMNLDDMIMTVLSSEQKTIPRFSNTHKRKLFLKGIIGEFVLANVPSDFVPYLYMGEITHIGKNTSLGFGRYEVTPIE